MCLLVWGLHAVLVAVAFPLSELFTQLPLVHIDSPFHQYQVDVARELWEKHSLIGYDPWFAAGSIGGVNYNASAKAPALLAIMLSPVFGTVIAYKLYVFMAALVAPGFVLWAMRLLAADAVTAIAAMVLGVLLWWVSALHWYHTAGMVAFVLASYASLPYILLAWRSTAGALSAATVLALGVFGAIGMFVHPLFPIPVIFTVPFLVAANWKQVRPKALVLVAVVVPILCLLPNIVWMVPSLRYPGWSDGSLSPFQKVVDIHIVFLEAIGRIEGAARGARLYPLMWACALWALSSATESRLRRVAAGFVCAILALVVFSAVGAYWPVIGTLQPNRLSAAAYLLLIVPAAIGIGSAWRALGRTGIVRYMALMSMAVLLLASAFFGRELKNEVSSAQTAHYGRPAPEVGGEGGMTEWLGEWIRRNTTDQARILFETSQGRVHDGAHIAGRLVHATGREFIGGPYVFMHHAGFWDGHVFGRPIDAFSVQAFSAQLELYNIGWIIVHSPVSKAYLDAHPQLSAIARHGPLTIYRVQQEPDYFLEGKGRVVGRKLDRIELDDVEGPAVTIKYHFVNGLVTDPPATLQSVYRDGDPQPFIRVLAPARRLAIVFP